MRPSASRRNHIKYALLTTAGQDTRVEHLLEIEIAMAREEIKETDDRYIISMVGAGEEIDTAMETGRIGDRRRQ